MKGPQIIAVEPIKAVVLHKTKSTSTTYYLWIQFSFCRSSWWDFFLPVTMYEWLWTGKYGHEHCLGLLAFYTIIWVGPLTLGFFGWELYLIYSGMTPHEINKSEKNISYIAILVSNVGKW